MTTPEALHALEEMGTAQNRKVYARHGTGPDTFGVSFANLGKLRKRIGRDHVLARELWASGNFDARCLALLVADPGKATSRELDQWAKSVTCYTHADLLALHVAGKAPFAKEKAEAWAKSKHDFTAQAGYATLAVLAKDDGGLPDAYFEQWLRTIEAGIHAAGNRTRHAMNNALIAIGVRNSALEKLALKASARIGKVEVDHGETNCSTPDAAAYILKAVARKASRR